MKPLKLLALAAALMGAQHASAIGIGSLTTEMQENEFYVVKQIKNDDSIAKFVSTEVQEITNPRQLTVLQEQKKDVLISPATVFLPPHRTADVKIYYQGKRDDKERYYQLSFVEQAVSSQANISDGVSLSAKQRIRLSSILVVRPRTIHFKFENDGNGRVKNIGNTFVHVTATGKCEEKGATEPKACSRSTFLLPGESGDMRKEKGLVSLQGIGVWKGSEYQYFPMNAAPSKVVAK
ncbi:MULTISPECIES: fimbria/pilus periplasmic chaperone [unclassified Burkholderia]|uniref:EcpB family pilus assembly chaperone n=1 Tax=unclassified Burkholderia TaxID=2613784 RepID=UPI0007563EF3|nr:MULTISPECIES: fimbria/pilus periplasmic chaperone [unclassified Burkholderia]KUY55239.1 hypothetical protein WS45_02595 [Burkholderia sp. RF2-non_BP3]KUY83098.1 hypothetical protein WS46_13020 [Burkholderia sp. RF4-BP95]KUY90178.1 hypothetical protein WS49_29945 [Burkholderia sp. RF7-non_BP4]KUZ03413.1 hypothetical protein WS48_02145 [Burkholderia sp. RF7-non_BP1]